MGYTRCQLAVNENGSRGATAYFQKIEDARYVYPMVAPNRKIHDLIFRLTRRNVRDRLGVRDINEIKNHPFYQGVDWDNLHQFVPPGFNPTPPCQNLQGRCEGCRVVLLGPAPAHCPIAVPRMPRRRTPPIDLSSPPSPPTQSPPLPPIPPRSTQQRPPSPTASNPPPRPKRRAPTPPTQTAQAIPPQPTSTPPLPQSQRAQSPSTGMPVGNRRTPQPDSSAVATQPISTSIPPISTPRAPPVFTPPPPPSSPPQPSSTTPISTPRAPPVFTPPPPPSSPPAISAQSTGTPTFTPPPPVVLGRSSPTVIGWSTQQGSVQTAPSQTQQPTAAPRTGRSTPVIVGRSSPSVVGFTARTTGTQTPPQVASPPPTGAAQTQTPPPQAGTPQGRRRRSPPPVAPKPQRPSATSVQLQPPQAMAGTPQARRRRSPPPTLPKPFRAVVTPAYVVTPPPVDGSTPTAAQGLTRRPPVTSTPFYEHGDANPLSVLGAARHSPASMDASDLPVTSSRRKSSLSSTPDGGIPIMPGFGGFSSSSGSPPSPHHSSPPHSSPAGRPDQTSGYLTGHSIHVTNSFEEEITRLWNQLGSPPPTGESRWVTDDDGNQRQETDL